MTTTAMKGGAQPAAQAVLLGVERYGLGDLHGAAEEMRRALRHAPEDPRASRYLGWIQRVLRERGETIGQGAQPIATDSLSALSPLAKASPTAETGKGLLLPDDSVAEEPRRAGDDRRPPFSQPLAAIDSERRDAPLPIEAWLPEPIDAVLPLPIGGSEEPLVEVQASRASSTPVTMSPGSPLPELVPPESFGSLQMEELDLEAGEVELAELELDVSEDDVDMAELIAAAEEWDERSSGRSQPVAASSSARSVKSSAPMPAAESIRVLPTSGLSLLLSDIPIFDREARSAAVMDREARSAAVMDREARSAAVMDREARSAAVMDREARSSLSTGRPRPAASSTPGPPSTAAARPVSAASERIATKPSGLSDLLSDVPLIGHEAPAGGSATSQGRKPPSFRVTLHGHSVSAEPPATPAVAAVPPGEISGLFSSIPMIEADRQAEALQSAVTPHQYPTVEQPLSPLTPTPPDEKTIGEAEALFKPAPPAMLTPLPALLPRLSPSRHSVSSTAVPAQPPPTPKEAPHDDELDLIMIEEAPESTSSSMGSPLRVEDLFADLEIDASAPPRPLVARSRTGETPDFTVEFDDLHAQIDQLERSDQSDPGPAKEQPDLHDLRDPRPGLNPASPAADPLTERQRPASARQAAPVGEKLGEVASALRQGELDPAFDLLEQVMAVLDRDPEAARLHQSRAADLYEAFLQPLSRIPRAGRFPADLDSPSAFMLSLLDGSMTIEEALTVSGMDRLRSARTMALLLRRNLIRLL